MSWMSSSFEPVFDKYQSLIFGYAGLSSIGKNYLLVNSSNMAPFPFGAGINNSSVVNTKQGDFVAIANTSDIGDLMLGYIAYLYNNNPGSSVQVSMGQIMSYILIYAALDSSKNSIKSVKSKNYLYNATSTTKAELDSACVKAGYAGSACIAASNYKSSIYVDFHWMWQVFTNAGYESSGASLTVAEIVKELKIYYSFKSGFSAKYAQLISDVASGQLSSASSTDLYSLLDGVDWSDFSTAFPATGSNANYNAYVNYFKSVLQAMANGNLYFNCGLITNSSGTDVSYDQDLYGNFGSSKVAQATITVQSEAAKVIVAAGSKDINITDHLDVSFLTSDQQEFAYLTGDFYRYLSGKIFSAAYGLSTMQASVCSKSSSYNLKSAMSTVLKELKGLGSDVFNAQSSFLEKVNAIIGSDSPVPKTVPTSQTFGSGTSKVSVPVVTDFGTISKLMTSLNTKVQDLSCESCVCTAAAAAKAAAKAAPAVTKAAVDHVSSSSIFDSFEYWMREGPAGLKMAGLVTAVFLVGLAANVAIGKAKEAFKSINDDNNQAEDLVDGVEANAPTDNDSVANGPGSPGEVDDTPPADSGPGDGSGSGQEVPHEGEASPANSDPGNGPGNGPGESPGEGPGTSVINTGVSEPPSSSVDTGAYKRMELSTDEQDNIQQSLGLADMNSVDVQNAYKAQRAKIEDLNKQLADSNSLTEEEVDDIDAKMQIDQEDASATDGYMEDNDIDVPDVE
jgi:hypothetical protein